MAFVIRPWRVKEQFTNEDALVFCRFIRVGSSWEFLASGEKHNGSLNKLIELFT
jgi:stress response protein SCP2